MKAEIDLPREGFGERNDAEAKSSKNSDLKIFYRLGAIAAFVQLLAVFMTLFVVVAFGTEPTSAEEYFRALQENRLVALLRMDFASVLNVFLFSVTMLALYFALRKEAEVFATLALILVILGVSFGIESHSGFSILRLSEQYNAATTEAERTMLLAAGEAVIASDWWNSFAGFMAGICLQGGTVLMSLMMLRKTQFSKYTAYSGILANGLDCLHVLIGLFAPAIGNVLLSIGGLVYLLWYPLLGRDLLRQNTDK